MWDDLIAGRGCPLCAPRADESDAWSKVATLGCSTLYLDRNQTYRGHCQLVFDPRHAVGLENLTDAEYRAFAEDTRRASLAIVEAVRPDLMNYATLGNVMPHLHTHLVPRYRTDPRWGAPIYTSKLADMPVTRLADPDRSALLTRLRSALAGRR